MGPPLFVHTTALSVVHKQYAVQYFFNSSICETKENFKAISVLLFVLKKEMCSYSIKEH